MNAKPIPSLVLLGLIVVCSVQNYEVVQLRFLFWQIDTSRAVLFFLVLAAGRRVRGLVEEGTPPTLGGSSWFPYLVGVTCPLFGWSWRR